MPVKLILPDWDDVVDPEYDFLGKTFSPQYREDRYKYGVRIWHIYNPPPVDGVLISISTVSERKLKKIRESGNIRNFLRLPNGLQVIGDCGAWQYRYEEIPPYKPEEVLTYYNLLGVDYGVALDHIPFFGDPDKRMGITLNNAVISYRAWRPRYERGDYKFVLMAPLQGVEIGDYIRMFNRLYQEGYRHFAVGGLARRTTEFIKRLVRELVDTVRDRRDIKKIHFLGIARSSAFTLLGELDEYVDEVSFDNTTYLRMAWSRSVGNYVLPDGRVYTAIRLLEGSEKDYELIRAYAKGEVGLNEVVSRIRDVLAKTGNIEYLPYYVATLKDRPWEVCDCPVCRKHGVEILIFKGNDRNRRRGFHNVYVFNKLLKESRLRNTQFKIVKTGTFEFQNSLNTPLLEELIFKLRNVKKVLVLTHCTAEKDVNHVAVVRVLARAGLGIPSMDIGKEPVYREVLKGFIKPAAEMYKGTFTVVRNLVNSLRACGREVDLYIVSARYGVLRERDPVIPYDATLKGMSISELREWARARDIDNKLKELSGIYDLYIAVLPREYLIAVRNFLNKVPPEKLILVAPTTASKYLSISGYVLLPGGNIQRRLRYVKLLTQASKRVCHKTLSE